MDIIRYIISIVLGVLGLYGIVCNWYAFVLDIKKIRFVSCVPFIGGIALCLAFVIIPNNPYVWLWWVAFIIDYGSLPVLCRTIVSLVIKKHKK